MRFPNNETLIITVVYCYTIDNFAVVEQFLLSVLLFCFALGCVLEFLMLSFCDENSSQKNIPPQKHSHLQSFVKRLASSSRFVSFFVIPYQLF